MPSHANPAIGSEVPNRRAFLGTVEICERHPYRGLRLCDGLQDHEYSIYIRTTRERHLNGLLDTDEARIVPTDT
jgi:hypothetical protein